MTDTQAETLIRALSEFSAQLKDIHKEQTRIAQNLIGLNEMMRGQARIIAELTAPKRGPVSAV